MFSLRKLNFAVTDTTHPDGVTACVSDGFILSVASFFVETAQCEGMLAAVARDRAY
jgi:hypothetical protein